MIALQQPVTTDLRRIITVMKASSDWNMEIMRFLPNQQSCKGQTRIPKIEKKSRYVRFCEEMVDNVLVAYVKMDQQDAKMIAAMDEE